MTLYGAVFLWSLGHTPTHKPLVLVIATYLGFSADGRCPCSGGCLNGCMNCKSARIRALFVRKYINVLSVIIMFFRVQLVSLITWYSYCFANVHVGICLLSDLTTSDVQYTKYLWDVDYHRSNGQLYASQALCLLSLLAGFVALATVIGCCASARAVVQFRFLLIHVLACLTSCKWAQHRPSNLAIFIFCSVNLFNCGG